MSKHSNSYLGPDLGRLDAPNIYRKCTIIIITTTTIIS